MNPTITASGLAKRYGDVVALDGLDLEVPEGTVLGLLGPNGAGKTTAVRILTTLLEPDAGEVTIAGINLRTDPGRARGHIGLSGQNAAVDEYLTGYENLYIVGRLYGFSAADSRARARTLIDDFALTDAGDRTVKTYSGGMRRRLDLAAAIVAKPSVLFLDEPTTGLDPNSRNMLWGTIRRLVENGSTVLLTTQYMDEADQLADDIVVIAEGREIAHGRPRELKRTVGGDRVEVVVERDDDVAAAEATLRRTGLDDIRIDSDSRRLTAPVSGGPETLSDLLRSLAEADVRLHDVSLRQPTLDDVFVTLTGHGTTSSDDERDDAASRQEVNS
ncbi:daunorubicin resistance protein DrrA family ABC transporter ATP-binding protein [Saccharomonospora iraqiensis]|uniref:daunorubicin resistance protein DrrA family ABC transporter ATP-binding protein n=1 Tax=Saccharomonospora iraqiensis TaxID=52698 RepID=UPI00022E67D1|nr:daunorubicin resistance protein DrrA family ABC transporter ATP-binding protein [Saccharomonospora iraqiensis]